MNNEKIKNIAYANARKIIAENNLDVDINDLALRILPKVEEQEEIRLQEKSLEINSLFEEKLEKTKKEKKKGGKGPIVFYSKFEEEAEQNSSLFEALAKKSKSSDIPLEIIGEVFDRGYNSWDDSHRVSQDQYAFARVNSYINKGKTFFEEDADLHEISKETLKSYLVNRGPNAKNPTYNTKYHEKIKKQYGNDDPEVKQYDKMATRHAARVKSIDRAEKRVGSDFNHQDYLKDKMKTHQSVSDKYGPHKIYSTPAGNGKVVGAGKKKDHVVVRINTSTGIRKKYDNKYEDHEVHKSHLNEISNRALGKYIEKSTEDRSKSYKKSGEATGKAFRYAMSGDKKKESEQDEISHSQMLRGMKRSRGISKAQSKLSEELDSQSEKIRKLNRKFRDQRRRNKEKLDRNRQPIETNENIQELSKKTLSSYIEKNQADNFNNSRKQSLKKKQNRTFGLEKATKKFYENEDTSKHNRLGEPDLVKKYKAETPGQEKSQIDPKDPKSVKEEVVTSDRIAVLVPAHKDGNGKTIPAKTHWRKSSKKIIGSGNVSDGK